MSLVALRAAIISSISSNISTFATVQAHGGKFNHDELQRIALKAPAALVVVLGGDLDRQGGAQAVGSPKIAVFILTQGDSETLRDEAALILVESVCGLVVNNAWDYEHAKAPEAMDFTNLFSGKLERAAVALWVVGWTQQTDLNIFDVTTLDDFHRAHVDWDLAPKDGVVDMEDDIWLNGEFMSAYGHIYVSTEAATGIAVAGTFQKAAGTTTLKLANDCDMPENGRIRHKGTATKPFMVSASCSVTVDSDAKVTLALAEGGVVDEDTAIEEEVTAAGGAESIPLKGLFNLSEDEYVEIWVTADDTVNVTLTKASLVAAAT